jgi:hypothetical protein
MESKEKATISRPITFAESESGSKDNHFVSQYQTVYQSFKERPKTILTTHYSLYSTHYTLLTIGCGERVGEKAG